MLALAHVTKHQEGQPAIWVGSLRCTEAVHLPVCDAVVVHLAWHLGTGTAMAVARGMR